MVPNLPGAVAGILVELVTVPSMVSRLRHSSPQFPAWPHECPPSHSSSGRREIEEIYQGLGVVLPRQVGAISGILPPVGGGQLTPTPDDLLHCKIREHELDNLFKKDAFVIVTEEDEPHFRWSFFMETYPQSEAFECWLHKAEEIPHGNCGLYHPHSPEVDVGSVIGPEGCVLACPDSSSVPALSSL